MAGSTGLEPAASAVTERNYSGLKDNLRGIQEPPSACKYLKTGILRSRFGPELGLEIAPGPPCHM
jgi:hypothetical protein